jgi:hypothetical protein
VLPDGKVREYLHLVPSKGHELPYLGSPTCDVEGRLVVGAERGFCTVDAHGQLSPPIEIRSADGLPLDCRDPVSDGHGRFWAEHNRTLVRFDEQGKIDRTLGDPLATDALRDIDSVRIAENGTIHVLSQDNRLIARIDAEGKRLVTVHLAGPGFDGRELHYDTPFAVGHDGSTWISPDSKSWIAFDAGGARHDPTWAVGTPTSEPLFESGRDRCWLMTGDKLLLAQRDGTVVRTIEKDPQGRWLSPTSAAVAPDGSIAVKCDRNTNATSTFEILDAEGNSPRLLESKAPSDGGIAWDGKEILFASHGNLHVLDVASGRDRELVLDQPGSDEVKVQSLTLVHDGREIWIQDGGQRIYRYSRP